jgi:release factor glutamine methyltransferase
MNTSLLATSRDWLAVAIRKLELNGISSASLDAIIILCFCLKLTKIEILSNPNIKLSKKQLKLAETLLNKRLTNYPIAYIVNSVEFYNCSFYVDSRVLVPRPESESFINLLKTENIYNLKYLTDVGCGSGVLGISSKLEFPHLQIELLDKSKNALKVSNINLLKFGLKADVKMSNLLSSSNNKFNIILANLPYVPKTIAVSPSVLFEPKMAIFANNDGLNFYIKMFAQLEQISNKPKYILVECLDQQIPILTKLMNKLQYRSIRSEGLVHMFLYDSKMTDYQV